MARAVLAVAVQRQVRQHEPVATRQLDAPPARTRGASAAPNGRGTARARCRFRGRPRGRRLRGGRAAASHAHRMSTRSTPRIAARDRAGQQRPAAATRCRPSPGAPRARAGGARALARARSSRVRRAARGRRAWVFYEGRRPPTARPARTTCSRACSRTSIPASRRCAATASSARAAGTATDCRWSSRSRRSSASPSKDDIEALRHRGVQPRCRESVFTLTRGLERADRADRVLDRPRRRLPHDGLRPTSSGSGGRSRRSHERGLLYERQQGRARTARAADDAVARTRSRRATSDVVDPCVYVRPADAADRCTRATSCSSGRRRRGRCPGNVAVARHRRDATYAARELPARTDLRRSPRRCVGGAARRGGRDPRADAGAELADRYGSYDGPSFPRIATAEHERLPILVRRTS